MTLSNEDKDYIDNELNKNFRVMAKERKVSQFK